MGVDPTLSSLTRLLGVEGPCLRPKTWESIPSESGIGASTACKPKSTPDSADSTVAEVALVRLVMNALRGVKAALDDIDRLSAIFSSTPADSTLNSVPNMWHRSTSTNALGRLLKSFSRAGYTFYFLSQFVDYLLNTHPKENGKTGKRTDTGAQAPMEMLDSNSTDKDGNSRTKTEEHTHPSCSLINQAFAVALRDTLDGHLCALDTLQASVKLRRGFSTVSKETNGASESACPESIINPGITVLEVDIHTIELRSRMEVLGNICCLRLEDLCASISSGESSSTLAEKAFSHFPHGADLLSYLYSQLRDCDPVHCSLLKFLFESSCQPYFGFIKSWIYSAKVEDLYGEFFVELVENTAVVSSEVGTSVSTIKERAGVSIPCFLESVRVPILRAGIQLQVLIKLLNFFTDFIRGYYKGEGVSIHLPSIDDVLPSGFSPWSNSLFCSSSLIFTQEGIRKMMSNRVITYKRLSKNLEIYFTRLKAGNQHYSGLVDSFDSVSPLYRENHKDFLTSSFLEKLNIPEPSNHDLSIRNVFSEELNASCSSDDSPVEVDSEQLSDSSSDGSEILSDFTQFVQLQDVDYKDLACCALNALQPSNHEHHSQKGPLYENTDLVSEMQSQNLNQLCIENDKFGRSSYPVDHDKLKDPRDKDYLPIKCWPLGALPRNPFYSGTDSINQCGYDSIDGLMIPNRNWNTPESSSSLSIANTSSRISEPNLFIRCIELNATDTKSFFSKRMFLPWHYASNYDLNTNPLLTKSSEIREMRNFINKNFTSDGTSSSFFHFSSVEDPYEVFLKRSTISHCLYEESSLPDSDIVMDSTVTVNSHKCNFFSPSNLQENLVDTYISERAVGGGSWAGMLRYSTQTTLNTDDLDYESKILSEIPLDIVIDRCILQEIISQYNYVSKFTIRLFEEGFGLQEHFLALHRYHFMESADWVNSFIASLWNHKWYTRDTDQRIGDIQNFLDQALRKSSCSNDPYKQRLYIYLEENSRPFTTADVGCFDFIRLGYRVDWPISIWLDPKTVGVYADIFNFLIKIRMSKLVLADLWISQKAPANLYTRQTVSKAQNKFSIFDETRLQINHFVSMLEQYVQSELSVVSRSRLLYSVKHQVKDMLDMKLVHRSYLAEALNICFLSIEAQPAYAVIRDILQCALQFQSCLTGRLSGTGFDEQIFSIKVAFERNLNNLYHCYLKSSNSGEPGLQRFWRYLDFNEYYSNVINVGMKH